MQYLSTKGGTVLEELAAFDDLMYQGARMLSIDPDDIGWDLQSCLPVSGLIGPWQWLLDNI